MIKHLETERLLLRPLSKDAAPKVLDFYQSNMEFFEPWEPKRSHNFYTLPYQKAFLTAEHNQIAEGNLMRFWVFLKDCPEEIIGTVCFQNILKEPYHSCSIGYKFSRSYQHQGYATESLRACLNMIFSEYPTHRVDAYIMPGNTASLRLIERLGFDYEGTCRSFARINGCWEDHKHYALIRTDEIIAK